VAAACPAIGLQWAICRRRGAEALEIVPVAPTSRTVQARDRALEQALDLESAPDLALEIGPWQERGRLATAVPQIAICRTFWIYQVADVAASAAALDRTDSETRRRDSAARW
jgi:hypothetical protein